MIYTLMIVTAVATSPVGTFTTKQECEETSIRAQEQGIKSFCVPQKTHEQVIVEMQSMLKMMQEQIQK